MQYKFFDENEFQYAIDMLETDPYHAEKELKNYTEKYPKDYYGRTYYALVLTRICKFEEAENIYNDILIESQNNIHFNAKYKHLEKFRYLMIVIKMKLLSWHERYQELYDLISNNSNMFEPSDVSYILYYCKAKLGQITDPSLINSSYHYRQAYDYSEELFREHMKKHMKVYYQGNSKLTETSDYIFEEDFPLDKAIEEVKKVIPSDLRTYPGYFNDSYFFKYKHCGKVKGQWANRFTVVCYHDTKDIVTMCPVVDYDKLLAKDLDNLRYETEVPKEEEKVKRLSQIDKFNKRFNLK